MIDAKLLTWVPEDWDSEIYVPEEQVSLCRQTALTVHLHDLYGDEPYMVHVEATVRATSRLVGNALPSNALTYLKCLAYIHDAVEHNWECQAEMRAMGIHSSLIEHANRLGGEAYSGQLAMLSQFVPTRVVKTADAHTNLDSSMRTGQYSRAKRYSRKVHLLTHPYKTKEEFLTEKQP